MKLGNKGFAITRILYTIFILFLMILLSVLGGLNTKRQLLEKNIEDINSDMEAKCYSLDNKLATEYGTTYYNGKYTFKIDDKTYTTYIPKSRKLTNDYLKSLDYLENDIAPSDFSNAYITEICIPYRY